MENCAQTLRTQADITHRFIRTQNTLTMLEIAECVNRSVCEFPNVMVIIGFGTLRARANALLRACVKYVS